MNSNTRAAEAVQVAPYLTHVVSHHGRLTLIPPENAGRTRKTSKLQAKKEKKSARRNGERSVRSEDSEEPRFNLGTPRSARSVGSGTSTRRRPARSAGETRSRGREGERFGEDINIPDYPPPTFQEATSSSVSSPVPTLSIPQSVVGDTSNSIAARLSPNPSPITDSSPTTSVTPSQRLLSIIVEPSTSLPSSPNTLVSSLPSPSPWISATALSFPSQPSSNPHPRSNSPLPPTPQSPGSDSSSDSQEFVCLPLEPSLRQWEEDRQRGLTLEERVQRELKRQRAAQADGTQPEDDAPSQPQSPTQAGPLRCKSQETLCPNRPQPQGRKGRATLQVPCPDRRLTLDEPSLRSMTSAPSLATQFTQKARSPRSTLRPSSPTSTTSRPYHSAGSASSTLSLSLGHLRLPGAFSRSTTSLGVLSQTGGRESTGSRRLFSKGKGKEKDKSLSDGDLDKREEEEALDSWEVVESPDVDEPGPSTKVRPRLALKSHLKAFDISTTTYGEKPVEGRGAGEHDTRVDPFPISAEPSSPETDRPSSISLTPTALYPPSTPFSAHLSTRTHTATSTYHPTSRVLDQDRVETRRQRSGSMRTRQAPPPPATFLSGQVHRPAPPPPPVCTGSIRATSPCSPTSPSAPSPLSSVSAPAAPSLSLRTKSPMPILTPTQIQSPTKRRAPPPPPPKTSAGPNVNWTSEPYDRALEVPLPPTLTDTSSVRGWTPTVSTEKERALELEVGRRYGYAPGPHPYFNASSTYTQSTASAPSDFPAGARARPADYTYVPPVPSRLAVSIPTYPQPPSLFSRSVASSPATPRGHYPGRPLPMTPGASSPVATIEHCVPPCAGVVPNYDQIHNHISGNGNVPEVLLIDFETDLDVDNNRSSGSMDRTAAASENDGDFSIFSRGHIDDEGRSVFESAGSSDTSIAPSPAVAASERPQFSEYTDLDVLLSRMGEENHDGTDYDALLLVQEFVGPAAQNPNANIPPSSLARLGRIEIDRRRVLKDGRVKLKISLLGTAVDKCGICLSQFKNSELASLTTVCRHAFHEKCLRSWLARSHTCPLCRVPLNIGRR